MSVMSVDKQNKKKTRTKVNKTRLMKRLNRTKS